MGEREKGLSKVKERHKFLQGNLFKRMNKASTCYATSQEKNFADGFFAGFQLGAEKMGFSYYITFSFKITQLKTNQHPLKGHASDGRSLIYHARYSLRSKSVRGLLVTAPMYNTKYSCIDCILGRVSFCALKSLCTPKVSL
ncbi:hypothetical protein NC653_020868 [Populus alba x Populus x berolinensis]|uniref:Uncharacterized protein n=1 Tax=Populus alba x Populus x berolinensis TaxID=444605 RepID=A0AAD6QCZ1_9ROSI|nr:hypothetical protein NC653_020866 [Populus alba x Populus x berolinensis]KAJ6987744.1 hypothetical protein NC653_020868 [Populus alba x Populus x berolinensis]